MSDFVKFSHTYGEAESINAAHNLAPMDLTKVYADDIKIDPGTLLKAATGKMTPWIQGVDNANLIVGICSHHMTLDTGKQVTGLVRVFGPVRKARLRAWTAANGSTTAEPNAAALTQLEAMKIYAL